MSHFATVCCLMGISALALDNLQNIVGALHELNFRGLNVALLISCQERANGKKFQLITDNAMYSVKSNYDDSVWSKSKPP